MRPVSDAPSEEILDRDTFLTEFKTEAYLQDFYAKVEDPAMQMVLPAKWDECWIFGAGPTIHVAASFRNQAAEVHLADYLPQNRKELSRWCGGRSNFDWSEPLKMILSQEGNSWNDLDEMITLTRQKVHLADYLPQNRKELSRWCGGRSNFDWSEPLKMILSQEGNSWNDLDEMITLTRQKVRGVHHCDCLKSPSIDAPAELQGRFDVVVTIFCVEYCCKTYEEYKKAIKNVADQIAPGGFLVMGGILEETWCAFGGRVFSCLYITRNRCLNALDEAGVRLENDRKCILYEVNDMFVICARKRHPEKVAV
ncbi:NNMT/PNMT/TEMT family protein [Ostertagia ostertagi]